MAYENKPNTGALFKNENKQTENQPDYTGPYYAPDGTEMRIAAWLKTASSGKKYMSIQVSEKMGMKDLPKEPEGAGHVDLSDDIPFSPCK